jgi:hypothetical protein
MKVVSSFEMDILEPFSWMKHGLWEYGNLEGYCLRRNGYRKTFRVDPWELEYGIEDVSSYGRV